jgi:hypothetical protein
MPARQAVAQGSVIKTGGCGVSMQEIGRRGGAELMGDQGSSVNVDLTAKASLEIKAEVPKESTGRTLDALVDVIRPFTEGRGLKADRIRLQRAEIAYEIAKIARNAAELENLELTPPPTKFMVPFLEKASLEDEETELHCRWAALLLSASTHYEAQHLAFMHMLTRFSSDELTLLEEVCLACPKFPELHYPDRHMRLNESTAAYLARTFILPGDRQRKEARTIFDQGKEAREIFDERIANTHLMYGHIMYAGVRYQGMRTVHILHAEYGRSDKRKSLALLERERLVAFEERGSALEKSGPVGWFDVTFMGVQFVRDCSPAGRERARKHLEEKKAKIVPVQSASPELRDAVIRELR